MNEFNSEKIKCPHCNGPELWAIKDNNKVKMYSCGNCGSDFDPDHDPGSESGVFRYFLKRRKPGSVRSGELDYTHTYEVYSKTIKE